MFNLIRSLGFDTLARAQALKILRWIAATAGASLTTWLLSRGVSMADTTAIVASAGGLILSVGSALVSLGFSLLDGKKVDAKIIATAGIVAKAPAVMIPRIANYAQAAARGDASARTVLARTLATLRAGQA